MKKIWKFIKVVWWGFIGLLSVIYGIFFAAVVWLLHLPILGFSSLLEKGEQK